MRICLQTSDETTGKGNVSLGGSYSAENVGVLGSQRPFLSPHGENRL